MAIRMKKREERKERLQADLERVKKLIEKYSK